MKMIEQNHLIYHFLFRTAYLRSKKRSEPKPKSIYV